MRRRDFVTAAVAAPLAAAPTAQPIVRKGRMKQGVTIGVFPARMSFMESCRVAARLGVKGYDLRGPADWPVLKRFGLVPTMYPGGPGGQISDGLNRVENHNHLEKRMHA